VDRHAVDLIFGSHSQLRAFAEVLCVCGREGEVRAGLCGGLDQGDERGSLRSRLTAIPAATLPPVIPVSIIERIREIIESRDLDRFKYEVPIASAQALGFRDDG
jgi:hypothetical protein